MENMDQTIGTIFKNLGGHECRINDHAESINNIVETANKAIKNLDWRIKALGVAIFCLRWLMNNRDKQQQSEIDELREKVCRQDLDIIELKCEMNKLKQVEGE